jgi:hypothetical protein
MVKINSPTAATPMDSLKPYTSQMGGGGEAVWRAAVVDFVLGTTL